MYHGDGMALVVSGIGKVAAAAATAYLVRARGECGTAPMGNIHDGTPRHGTACE